MSGFATVIYEKLEHLAYVTLNRPGALNTYSMQMRDDLYEVFSAICSDDDIRVVILNGAGEKAFCAGADLTEFLTAPSAVLSRQIRLERDLWRLLLRVPQPIIAAIHGYVLGSGMEIAGLCDIRIASEDAIFGLPEVGLGILPGASGTQTALRSIGLAHSLDMLLTSRWVDCEEALRMGLINRMVPRGLHVKAAGKMAERIASFSPEVVRRAKQAIVRGMDLSLSDGLDMEQKLMIQK